MQRIGPVTVALLPAGQLLLWLFLWPAGNLRQVLGELVASSAVLLLAVALFLATRSRVVEPSFGGLDKVYRAHRRAGQAGMVLLACHVALTPWRLTSAGGVPTGLIAFAGLTTLVVLTMIPRIRYGAWRRSHRWIGVFFLIAGAHLLLVDSVTRRSPVLFAVVLLAFVLGTVSYAYTLLLAGIVRPRTRCRVDWVRPLGAGLLEIALRPAVPAKRPASVAGQFVFVRFRRRGLREPHPFTVSSAPGEAVIRLTVKAAGDFTGRLLRDVRTGDRALVEGGYGRFDFRTGARRQVWVAGGVGVTPFLSWLRSLEAEPDQDVDFFYVVRTEEDAVFWPEIEAIAAGYARIRPYLWASARTGRLTAPEIVAVAGAPTGLDVYVCGPAAMAESLRRGLPGASIHTEEFRFR